MLAELIAFSSPIFLRINLLRHRLIFPFFLIHRVQRCNVSSSISVLMPLRQFFIPLLALTFEIVCFPRAFEN